MMWCERHILISVCLFSVNCCFQFSHLLFLNQSTNIIFPSISSSCVNLMVFVLSIVLRWSVRLLAWPLFMIVRGSSTTSPETRFAICGCRVYGLSLQVLHKEIHHNRWHWTAHRCAKTLFVDLPMHWTQNMSCWPQTPRAPLCPLLRTKFSSWEFYQKTVFLWSLLGLVEWVCLWRERPRHGSTKLHSLQYSSLVTLWPVLLNFSCDVLFFPLMVAEGFPDIGSEH